MRQKHLGNFSQNCIYRRNEAEEKELANKAQDEANKKAEQPKATKEEAKPADKPKEEVLILNFHLHQ